MVARKGAEGSRLSRRVTQGWMAASIASAVFLLGPAIILTSAHPSALPIAGSVWLGLLVVASAAYLGVVGIELLASYTPARGIAQYLIEFSAYFVVLASLAFPLGKSTQLTEVSDHNINGRNLLICAAFALALWLLSRRFGRYVRIGLAVYLIGNATFLVLAIGGNPGEPPSHGLSMSAATNIVVLSFDGLSGSAMKWALESEKEIADELAGFVVYDRAIATSPATAASIAAELYGNANFKAVAGTTEELWKSNPDRLLTNVLLDHGYQVSTYGTYSRQLDRGGVRVTPSVVPSTTILELVNMSMARAVSPMFALRGDIARDFILSLSAVVDLGTSNRELTVQIRDSDAPIWSRNLSITAADFYEILDGMHVSQESRSAVFLHFTHTHFPVKWDKTCAYRAGVPGWYAASQDVEGIRGESICALKRIREFLDRLDELGLLSNSTVVLKSDHGKPTSYFTSGVESAAINGHSEWGLSRYDAFLAIKPAGRNMSPRRFDLAPVLIDDLARTLCVVAQISYDCGRFSGFDLLREDLENSSTSIVTAFVVDSPKSDHRFDTHIAVPFRRGVDPLMSLYRELEDRGMLTSEASG